MRRAIGMLAVVIACRSGVSRAEDTGSAMADAASRFLAALNEPNKALAAYPFDSPERTNWHWIPRERKGVPIKALGPAERALAFGLLGTGLSTHGAIKATTIMSLEEILREKEHGTGPVRDSQLYFLSVFGTPSDKGDWGWRIEGHHLALNFTLHEGKVIGATPFMFGSNPAEVRSGPRKGLRNMADIEEPAAALLASLTPDQKKTAVVSDVAPDVTTNENSAQPVALSPVGLDGNTLGLDQRKLFLRLLDAYFENFPPSVCDQFRGEVASHQPDFHFAWFGSTEPGKPHAFRLQGPTFFIDFNDTQDGANHIHTFYRNMLGDFGANAAH